MSGRLEALLQDRYDGRAARLYARGATALYALFRALREARGPGEVLLPEICCETVALPALYAGLTPVPVDCDPETLCLSADAVARHVGPSTRAVVLVYAFGNTVPVEPFLRLRAAHGFVLVEDIAQATGGERAGEEIGRAGDFTLLSFAADKIVPGDGGALVERGTVHSEELARIAASLPAAPPERVLRQKALSLRNLCHSLYELGRAEPDRDLSTTFTGLVPAYRDLIDRAGTVAAPEAAIAGLQGLREERAARRARYLAYAEGIEHPHVRVVASPEGSTCWRCCLSTAQPEDAFEITAALRERGLPASNHYFPLGRLLGARAAPAAAHVAARIVNVWVDASQSDDRLRLAVDVVNGHARTRDPRRASWTR